MLPFYTSGSLRDLWDAEAIRLTTAAPQAGDMTLACIKNDSSPLVFLGGI